MATTKTQFSNAKIVHCLPDETHYIGTTLLALEYNF